jgi:surface polysaccharide O-acyltransferase-like enzyme
MVKNVKLAGNRRKRILFYLLPAVGYAALIFTLSSSSLDIEELRPVFEYDKLLHIVEYYILGYLLMRAFTTSDVPFLAARPVAAAILVGCAYGLSDEIHQAFVPGRDCSLMDFLFDAAGATLAACTYSRVRHQLGFVRILENRIEAEVSRR